MDYSWLIREAWRMTRRHRFLWALGLFAGGGVGGSYGLGGGGGGPRDGAQAPAPPIPGVDLTAEDVARWVADNLGLVLAAAAVLVLLGLVLLVVSLIAQGGMARATVDLAEGRPGSLGRAWAAGRRLFWRYLGLWLLLGIGAAVVAALGAAFVALVVGLSGPAGPDAVWVVTTLVLGLPLLVAGVVVAIGLSIVVPYAQRAIADGDIGPLAALRTGWRVLRARPGPSLLVWLLNLVLGVAAAVAIGLAMVGVVLVLGIPAVALWAAMGLAVPTVAYLVAAALAALAALLALTAIANTFFWSYWTLAYLRLAPERPAGGAA